MQNPWVQWAASSTQASSLLSDPMEERNGTNSTRFLRLPEWTSAAWYILTIVGIYGVIIFFRLASNILKKNDKSFEDIYYSNLTYELKKKTFESKVAKCSSLTLSNTDVLQPGQASLGSKCARVDLKLEPRESTEREGRRLKGSALDLPGTLTERSHPCSWDQERHH
uniref:Small integral membrane protein 34A n=1 Tax=Spermophilus dauricus TaxID=99837 RepID=A0A8C9P1J9_SPEDA